MTHLNTYNPHHKSGNSRAGRDSDMILKVITAVEINPFTSKTKTLLNIKIASPFYIKFIIINKTVTFMTLNVFLSIMLNLITLNLAVNIIYKT